MIRNLILFAILSCFGTLLYANEIKQIDFKEYKGKIESLDSVCLSKNMARNSGFCLPSEISSPPYSNETRTSIDIAREAVSFEYFYNACEHSESQSASDIISKAIATYDLQKIHDGMSKQTDAIANYVGHFYFCKTKKENDATISNRLQWFEYMTANADRIKHPQTKDAVSHKPAKVVVECILSKYQGSGHDFFADGILAKDGSIIVALFAPTQLPLAAIKNTIDGSTTQYANTESEKYKIIPKADVFSNAVIVCQ